MCDLVTRSHFRSCDKDGGHTIRYTVVKNSMLHANFMALSFIEPVLWAMGNRSFTLRE